MSDDDDDEEDEEKEEEEERINLNKKTDENKKDTDSALANLQDCDLGI